MISGPVFLIPPPASEMHVWVCFSVGYDLEVECPMPCTCHEAPSMFVESLQGVSLLSLHYNWSVVKLRRLYAREETVELALLFP